MACAAPGDPGQTCRRGCTGAEGKGGEAQLDPQDCYGTVTPSQASPFCRTWGLVENRPGMPYRPHGTALDGHIGQIERFAALDGKALRTAQACFK